MLQNQTVSKIRPWHLGFNHNLLLPVAVRKLLEAFFPCQGAPASSTDPGAREGGKINTAVTSTLTVLWGRSVTPPSAQKDSTLTFSSPDCAPAFADGDVSLENTASCSSSPFCRAWRDRFCPNKVPGWPDVETKLRRSLWS